MERLAGVSTTRKLALIYTAAAAVIIASGLFFYNRNKTALIHKSGEQLQSIAVFKTTEISDWIKERQDNTLSLTDSPILSQYFAALANKPSDEKLRAQLQARLVNYLKHNNHYYSAAIVDAGGRPLILAGTPAGPLQPEEARVMKLVKNAKEAVLSDFYVPAGGGKPRLCVISPAGADRPVRLYLRLLIDPEVFLYPKILLWPANSASGETLLIRREGDRVIYLNRARFTPAAALQLSRPLDSERLPAAMALRNHKGVIEGVDYRNREVLAYVNTIPETGWALVTKIDKDEILAPARANGLLLLLLILAVLAGAGNWLYALAKRAEAELTRSEDKFRIFFENSSIGESITGLDGSLSVNQALCGMLGYSKDELRRRKWNDITHPDDIAATSAIMKEMLGGNRTSVRYEKRFIHKTGRIINTEISSALQRDPAGKPEYFLTSVNDITDRKRMEAALRESEIRYRETVELAVDGILMGLPDGKIIAANSQMMNLTGRALGKLLGLHVSELFDAGELKANPLKFDQLKDGRTVFSERSLLRHDGTLLPVEMHSKLMPDGTYQSIYRDVTERKRGEQALSESQQIFSKFMEHSPVYVFFKDEKIRTLRLSRNYENMLGKPLAELIGKSTDDLFPSDLAKKIVADDIRILNEGKVLTVDEEFNGRFYTTIKFPISIDGKPTYLAGYTIDITERRLLEEEKNKLNASLIEKKQEMENFLYITTHDLRSPLVNIQGFSQNLERYMKELTALTGQAALPAAARAELDKITREQVPGALQFILESSRKMDSLITALLKVSRIGRVEMKPETVDVNELLKNISASLSYQLQDAGGELKYDRLPPCVADPGAVSQLFSNLLDNAVKYRAKSRPLVITVTGEVKGRMVVYALADNGSGIQETDLHRIWNVFYRPATATKIKGEGIGLPMCRRIAEKNGGSIKAESEEGKGSVFYLELPAAERGD